MNTEHAGRDGGLRPRALLVVSLVSVFIFFLGGIALGAGLLSANYNLNWDQVVDKTATETTDTRTLRHTLETKYTGFLSPIMRNEISLKIEQEVKSDAEPKSTTRISPTINLSYKGSYWNAGAIRTIEDSNEPDVNRILTDSYFVEIFYEPPRTTLPELKARYTLDQDYQSEASDTSTHNITLSSVYRPMRWIDFKGDYERELKDDDLTADSDTENEDIAGTVRVRHFISNKIKLATEFRTQLQRGATLLDSGGAKNQKEDQTHTWKNAVSFRPFLNTNIDGSYDFDLKQNLASGEHTYTKNWKAAVTEDVSIFAVKGDFSRTINEARHTLDDNEKIEDIWTLDGNVKFSKQLGFLAKYQKKDTKEIHMQDSTKDITSGEVILNASWNGEITPFWKASVSYDKTDTIEKHITTKVETKKSFKSTFDFKAIKLLLEPTYDITSTEDRQLMPTVETETRDFNFKIVWRLILSSKMEAMIDHTYGRKTDSGAKNIERTDDSTGNLIWREPLPGWNVGFDVTRSATDRSEDDLQPDITSTFGFKMDYKQERFSWDMNYQYDKKNLADNSETFDFKVGWLASRWDVSLTYRFEKTFSAQLDEGYTINIIFKCDI